MYLPGTVNTWPQFYLHKMLMKYLLSRKMRFRDGRGFVQKETPDLPIVLPLSYTITSGRLCCRLQLWSAVRDRSAVSALPHPLALTPWVHTAQLPSWLFLAWILLWLTLELSLLLLLIQSPHAQMCHFHLPTPTQQAVAAHGWGELGYKYPSFLFLQWDPAKACILYLLWVSQQESSSVILSGNLPGNKGGLFPSLSHFLTLLPVLALPSNHWP